MKKLTLTSILLSTLTILLTVQITSVSAADKFKCETQSGLKFSCYSKSSGCPTNWISAAQNPDTTCGPTQTCCWYNPPASPESGSSTSQPSKTKNLKDVFGEITPPKELESLIGKGGQGAGGISAFLNNTITLIYEIAAIAVIVMLLWGGLEWILSGGEKEAVANARKRITNALIGLAILAVAFAVLNTFGIFTGFTTFFSFK